MIAAALRGRGGYRLAQHLLKTDENERVLVLPGRGLSTISMHDQIRELVTISRHHKTDRPLYHMHADPASLWSEADWADYWADIEQILDLEGQAFAEVEHLKHGRTHRHRVYTVVKATGTLADLRWDYLKRERAGRLAELRTGEPLTVGRHNRAVIAQLEREGKLAEAAALRAAGLDEAARPVAQLTATERAQALRTRTLATLPEIRAGILQSWKQADSAAAFVSALRDNGLVLAAGDKPGAIVVVDGAGGTHELARGINAARKEVGETRLPAAEIHAKLSGLDLLPTVASIRKRSGSKNGGDQVGEANEPAAERRDGDRPSTNLLRPGADPEPAPRTPETAGVTGNPGVVVDIAATIRRAVAARSIELGITEAFRQAAGFGPASRAALDSSIARQSAGSRTGSGQPRHSDRGGPGHNEKSYRSNQVGKRPTTSLTSATLGLAGGDRLRGGRAEHPGRSWARLSEQFGEQTRRKHADRSERDDRGSRCRDGTLSGRHSIDGQPARRTDLAATIAAAGATADPVEAAKWFDQAALRAAELEATIAAGKAVARELESARRQIEQRRATARAAWQQFAHGFDSYADPNAASRAWKNLVRESGSSRKAEGLVARAPQLLGALRGGTWFYNLLPDREKRENWSRAARIIPALSQAARRAHALSKQDAVPTSDLDRRYRSPQQVAYRAAVEELERDEIWLNRLLRFWLFKMLCF